MTSLIQSPQLEALPEYAYLESGVHWGSSEWPKNMLLFFDGVAVLLPTEETDQFYRRDEALIAGLENEKVLRLIRPEDVVDRKACDEIVNKTLELMDSKNVSNLIHNGRPMHFYISKLGYAVDRQLVDDLVSELRHRDLAKPLVAEHSISVHPALGVLLLGEIAQHVMRYGQAVGIDLHPSTDETYLYDMLTECGGMVALSETTKIVATDIEAAGIDLGSVPIDEIVGFRIEHKELLNRYRLGMLEMAEVLGHRGPKYEETLLTERRESLIASKSDLERYYREWLKGKARIGIGLFGAVCKTASNDYPGAMMSLVKGASGFASPTLPRIDRMTFLLAAGQRFGTL